MCSTRIGYDLIRKERECGTSLEVKHTLDDGTTVIDKVADETVTGDSTGDWVGLTFNVGGGQIQLNTVTGEIHWQSTNADVTVDKGSVAPGTHPYEFILVAHDRVSGGESPAKSFEVDVTDADTSINAIPDQTVNEGGSLFLYDTKDGPGVTTGNYVTAADEKVGPSYYTLEIERDGVAKVYSLQEFNDAMEAGGGHKIDFDANSGALQWDVENQEAGDNHQAVGNYHFTITHYDGHNDSKSTTFAVYVVNADPEFTTSAPDGAVVMATKNFYYDPGSTDEGLNDWRGDDQVVYSLEKGAQGMIIDPATGVISWDADPRQAGTIDITIKVDDGNTGVAYQSFSIIVDDARANLPLEARPDYPYDHAPNTSPSDHDLMGPGSLIGILTGDHPMVGEEIGKILSHGTGPASSITDGLEEIVHRGAGGFGDLMSFLEGHDLKQPSLEKLGSSAPPTPLEHYAAFTAHGKRLDFNAELMTVWNDLNQPTQSIAGSQSPETPLEGFMQAVEDGKRLNFNYFPIEEALSLKIDDLHAGDLLGL